jgi:hypothetical protein
MKMKSDRMRSHKMPKANRAASGTGKRGKNRSARYPKAQGR